MARYLITGAAGFVGTFFLEHLFKNRETAEVLCLDRDNRDRILTMPRRRCRFESIDLMDRSAFEATIREFKPRYILHLAAMSSVEESWREPALSIGNNLTILLNLLESVRTIHANCRVLTIGSSEVYRPSSKALDETMPIEPTNPYGVGRSAQEDLCRIYARRFDLQIVSTRSFMHIGPGQSERFAIASFLGQLLRVVRSHKKSARLKTGNVDVVRDITDVRDIVRAYDALLHEGQCGETYNVCQGEAHSLREIIHLASEMLGLQTTIEIDPLRLRPNDIEKVLGSNEKIKSQTAWQPEYTIKRTLKSMIDKSLLET